MSETVYTERLFPRQSQGR